MSATDLVDVELTQVMSFRLEYVDVDEIGRLLQPTLSVYGELTVFEKRNLFLVEGTPEFLRRVAALVNEIDEPPTHTLIEAKILEITLTDADSYRLTWSKTFTGNDDTGDFGTQGLGTPSSAGFFFDYAQPDLSATLNALTSQGHVRTLSSQKLLCSDQSLST